MPFLMEVEQARDWVGMRRNLCRHDIVQHGIEGATDLQFATAVQRGNAGDSRWWGIQRSALEIALRELLHG